jgi:hypothetical protein
VRERRTDFSLGHSDKLLAITVVNCRGGRTQAAIHRLMCF